jgi:hypothetical protein
MVCIKGVSQAKSIGKYSRRNQFPEIELVSEHTRRANSKDINYSDVRVITLDYVSMIYMF